jgi:chorismate dehydratase
MSKLRISVVQYLNTAPLVRGFTHGPLRGKYDLSFTVPSQCAEALRSGAADVAIIPAVEYQRMDALVVLPDVSIAAKCAVRSLLLLAKKPIHEARRIALDRSSRSTQALVRILCANHWKVSPQFIEAAPDPVAMLTDADAALVIGDPALRLALRVEPAARRNPAGALECLAADAGLAIPGAERLWVYDVVEHWRAMTALPAVMAFWAARREIASPELSADFLFSRDFGLARIPEISAEAAPELQLPAAALASYLRDNIDFSLDAANRRGLELYFDECAALGLIPRAKPIEWAAVATAARIAW